MKLNQSVYKDQAWNFISETPGFLADNVQLVLAFGERFLLERFDLYDQLRARYPNADIVINSTSGEIYLDKVHDDSIIVTAIEFEKTAVRTVQIDISKHTESYKAGEKIAEALDAPDLSALFLISDGSWVNGSDLIEALNQLLKQPVPVSGGLAGDGARFERTVVGLNQNPAAGKIVGIGFYGHDLKVGHGSMGGWDVFGPEREVTKATYNVLYQIDDKHALDLYKEYLGKYAESLPSAALLFPLSMRTTAESEPLVRTILAIDEETKSMTFAGEMPEKALVRFMKANFDRLIDASATAANTSMNQLHFAPELAILVSCIGRKLVLGQRTEEEVEAAREVFGNNAVMTGFYSYGEISPLQSSARCELHNQTMTVTVFSEN
ncbi:FIST signal transduction protein [Larkinella terrae]|uniref:Histidine kinase n=1 Tax=Larkinella terrae TaxID=2025311 RepID=A0A7K0EK05_9BACT|nr:FIST N-terminal domain-containing protein [Larkinella terrae]MRS62193.1 histidine kinase [Larkinella terrae]